MVKRRIKNISLAIIFGIFFISFVSAWNFPSSSTTSGTTTTVINNFTINGSTAIHNELDGLQGGIAGEYYHIKADWYNTLNSNINDWITESVSSLTHYYTDTEVDAINDSMKNYVDSVASGAYDDTWINDTIDNKISDNNDSVNNYIADNNASVNNYIADNNNSVNAYILYVNSTNSGIDTDTFVANYSTFLTHISWSNIINGTIWSWVMNGTLFQTSQWNATNTSYLVKTGDTMTGNLNLSANVNLTMNGGNQVSSNVTCVIIEGSTSVLEIC